MIIPLYGIISHTRSMTQSRIRGILAGFNRGIKRPINLSAFTAHIRLNMDGLKYLVFHPSRVSPCLGSWAFQSLSGFQVRCNALKSKARTIPITSFPWKTKKNQMQEASYPPPSDDLFWSGLFTEISSSARKRAFFRLLSLIP